MTIKGCLIAALCALSSWASAEPIKIVSWNVEWFPGRYPDSTPFQEREHMEEVRYALRRIKPDVLILVEVKTRDAVERALKAVPGLKLNAISSFEGRPQQIAIASRFPSRRGGQTEWARLFTGPPRGFTFAELQLPSNKCLQVYGVHLKSNRGASFVNETFRELAALQLEQFIHKFSVGSPCPADGVVIGGDFNTSMDDPRMAGDDSVRLLIGSGFYWPFATLPPAKRMTWLGDNNFPPIQFDHFLTQNVGAPVASVLKTGRTSDHSPIEIVIQTEDISDHTVPLPSITRESGSHKNVETALP